MSSVLITCYDLSFHTQQFKPLLAYCEAEGEGEERCAGNSVTRK